MGLGSMLTSGAGVQIAVHQENHAIASPAGHEPSLNQPTPPQREYDKMSNANISVVRLHEAMRDPSIVSVREKRPSGAMRMSSVPTASGSFIRWSFVPENSTRALLDASPSVVIRSF